MATQEIEEGGQEQGLLTLTELADKAGISMPTAAKYKKEHQDRIPTVGDGRTQKYPEKAVAVVQEIYQENLSKRGRSGAAAAGTKRKRKSGKRARRKTSKRASRSKRSTAAEGLMTLKDVAKKAGVSYPTATNYVKKHLDRIPHEGKGRTRKYPEEAVAAVRKIYKENLSKRGGGGRKKSAKTSRKSSSRARSRAAGAGDARLVSVLEKLEKRIAGLEKLMAKPLKVEIKR